MDHSNDRYITDALRRQGRICDVLLGLALVILLSSIFTPPAEVPLHWGADGDVDVYGSPWLTLIVWVVLAAVVALCRLVAANVDVRYWNKPSKVQPSELDDWYTHSMSVTYNVCLMISVMALGMALIYMLRIYWLMFPLIVIAALAAIACSIYANFNWSKDS